MAKFKIVRGSRGKVVIQKQDLVSCLRDDPYVTQKQLSVMFGCNTKTIAKELKRHGLSTRGWIGRKHTQTTKDKISETRIQRGVAKGSANPNFGDKPRPWLEGDNNPLRQWHKDNPDFGDNQRGLNNPIHDVLYLYEDEDYVAKITRGLREHTETLKGSSYEEVYGVDKAKSYKEKLRAASPERLRKTPRSDTEPELICKGLLEDLGLEFESQHVIGYYTEDFYLPDFEYVIQVDGDFWHANPEFWKDEDLYPLQKKNKRLDASCNSFLQGEGFGVLRLWESDLHNDPDQCITLISMELSL